MFLDISLNTLVLISAISFILCTIFIIVLVKIMTKKFNQIAPYKKNSKK